MAGICWDTRALLPDRGAAAPQPRTRRPARPLDAHRVRAPADLRCEQMAPRFFSSPYKNAAAQTAKVRLGPSRPRPQLTPHLPGHRKRAGGPNYPCLPLRTRTAPISSRRGASTGSRKGVLQVRPRSPLFPSLRAHDGTGHLICLPYDQPGKFNSRAPTLHAASRAITDFDLSPFDDLLAAGTEDGSVRSPVRSFFPH